MDLSIAFSIIALVLVGSYSLTAMGRYVPKRRKYSYLHYDESESRLPVMAWVHFWIFVGSYALNFWIIWSWGNR